MSSGFITVPVPDGDIRCWLVEADEVPATGLAVIVLPEIYNINTWIRAAASRYAELGHCVLVPDLFWRQEPGVDLAYTPQDQLRGRALSAGLDRGVAVRDLMAIAGWLRGCADIAAVAAVGFCLGGELAYLAAAEGALDGAVAYYPTRMGDHAGAGAAIDVPLQIHIGELDHRTPPDLVAAMRAELAGKPTAQVHVYAQADHGFGRFGHPPWHPPSAALADQRTHALLHQLAQRSHRSEG